jgi:hypothetical protein
MSECAEYYQVNVQSIIKVPECCCLGVPATTTREKCQDPAIKRHNPTQ